MAAACVPGKDDLIELYFRSGYTNLEIIATLLISHNLHICMSCLKRALVRLGLRRRTAMTAQHFHKIVATTVKDIEISGKCLGYRALWRRLATTYKLQVSRSVVMKLLKILDPVNVDRRKRKRLLRRQYDNPGPHYTWHVDGNDKLLPYGFGVHAAIDGFSRKIMWAEFCDTNKNPRVVGQYYLRCFGVKNGLVPCIVRCDCGTENTMIEKCQLYFRYENTDLFSGDRNIMYGKVKLIKELNPGGKFFETKGQIFGWAVENRIRMKGIVSKSSVVPPTTL